MQDDDARPDLSRAIRNPVDFLGGLALIALALLALYGSWNLEGGRGMAFGPGTAPRLFAGLLAVAGGLVVVMGLLRPGPALGGYSLRGMLFVTAAVLVFAVTIHPLGLVASSFLTIIVASLADPETRWVETLIWAVVLTVFCTVLFVYLLGLALPVWPNS